HLEPKLLEPPAGGGLVAFELLQQRPLALLLQVLRLARVGDVPAILRLGLQPRVVLLQTAQILEVRGQIAVDLAGDISVAVVTKEIVIQKRRQFWPLFVFLPPSSELRGEIRMYF